MRFPLSRAIISLAALVLIGIPALAQGTLTVDRLVEAVKSSAKEKNPDKDVAAWLSTVKLSQKLNQNVVEDLLSTGIGPKTVAALNQLVEQSASLKPAPAKVVMTPPVSTGPKEPSDAEKKKALDAAREFALNYVKSLPDFLCIQVTRRSVDMHYTPGTPGSWSQQDRIIEKLSFFDHKENYDLIQQNDNALVGKTWEALGGSISRGEWATVLSEIFQPATQTEFNWQRWGNIRGNLTHVYQYRVKQENSQETIAYEKEQKIVAGFHGLVYVTRDTNVVVRLTVVPDIPPSFPVQDVDQMVDYDFQKIGTETFLLPLRSQVQMRDGRIASKNELVWQSYRKYSADTSIKFDVVDEPLPDDKTKEQPVK